MDFFEKIEYTEEDLRELISSQAEESIHLDFKAAGALDKTNFKSFCFGNERECWGIFWR